MKKSMRERLLGVGKRAGIFLCLLGSLLASGCAALTAFEVAKLPPATATPVVKVVTVVVTVVVTATPTPELTSAVPTPTPSPTLEATEAPQVKKSAPTPTPEEAPEPVATPTQVSMKYPAPKLTFEDGTIRHGEGAFPILAWEPVTPELGADEYYEVTIERNFQNQPFYAGSDWTKQTEFIPYVFGTSDNHKYTWWVTVKLLTGYDSHGGKVGVPISPPSEQRVFYWYEG